MGVCRINSCGAPISIGTHRGQVSTRQTCGGQALDLLCPSFSGQEFMRSLHLRPWHYTVAEKPCGCVFWAKLQSPRAGHEDFSPPSLSPLHAKAPPRNSFHSRFCTPDQVLNYLAEDSYCWLHLSNTPLTLIVSWWHHVKTARTTDLQGTTALSCRPHANFPFSIQARCCAKAGVDAISESCVKRLVEDFPVPAQRGQDCFWRLGHFLSLALDWSVTFAHMLAGTLLRLCMGFRFLILGGMVI